MAKRFMSPGENLNPRLYRYLYACREWGIASISEVDLLFSGRRNVHRHRQTQLILPLENGLLLQVGQEDHVVRPDSLLVVPPDVTHYALELEGRVRSRLLDLRVVRDPPNPMDRYLQELAGPTRRVSPGAGSVVAERLRQAMAMAEPRRTAHVLAAVWSMLAAVEHAAPEEPASDDGLDLRIKYAEHYMMSYLGHEITPRDVARHVGISPSQLSRLYRKRMGTSPGSRLRQLRLDAARRLLRSTPLDVKQIAAACGLGSSNTLIRLFKQAYGHTPGAYRREKSWTSDDSEGPSLRAPWRP